MIICIQIKVRNVRSVFYRAICRVFWEFRLLVLNWVAENHYKYNWLLHKYNLNSHKYRTRLTLNYAGGLLETMLFVTWSQQESWQHISVESVGGASTLQIHFTFIHIHFTLIQIQFTLIQIQFKFTQIQNLTEESWQDISLECVAQQRHCSSIILISITIFIQKP